MLSTPGQLFDITRLSLKFRALHSVNIPAFAGSTWRGALGQALRRVACVYPKTVECRACMMRSVCWYTRLYEPVINPRCTILQGYTDAPHPLILEVRSPGGELAPGATANLDLVLIGEAKESVPILLQAIKRMVAHGLGRDRGELELTHWELVDVTDVGNNPWHPPELWPQVRVILETPLRLQANNRVLNPESLDSRSILTTLLRRISLLTCCHGSEPLNLDFKAFTQTATAVTITNRQLEWLRWERYSSSQKRHISMDGLIGELSLDLSQAPEWWPYLWAGQWLHVGKGISMDMGRYKLQN